MTDTAPAYGLWLLVVLNSAIFILFAFSFFKPQTARDWRSFGAFSAFLVALFTEMYGFPLTIYLISGWLQSRYPGVDWLSHDAGHLLEMLFGWEANPHFGPFHLLSFVFIGGGFLMISAAWRVLYEAQRRHALATTGPYAYVRHPSISASFSSSSASCCNGRPSLPSSCFRCLSSCIRASPAPRNAKPWLSSATPIHATWPRCRLSSRSSCLRPVEDPAAGGNIPSSSPP